ncbi:MAG: MFS transporter [Thermoanaerobaculia bacterium]|nr:MFS transporter [Thermoanaerobaculia bacterium]
MPSRRLLAWVAVLYLAQGLPYGIASRVWPVYFRAHGVSLVEIGLLGLVSLPWSWKPLWAPLVDRFGPRRAWIAPALVAAAALVAAIGELPPAVGPLLVALMLAFTFASATQDIAMDAWTVDAVRGRDLGPVNGLRAAAFRVAMIAAGGVALLVADRFGWRAAWLTLAAIFLALAAATSALPEPRRERGLAGGRSMRELLRSFLAWLLRPEMIPVVLFALLYKLGDQAMVRMIEPFWVDRGRSLAEIALVANTVGLALTIAGALVGGAFVARAGLYAGLLWLGLAQAATNLGYAAVAAFSWPPQALWIASAGENFAQGLGTAALLAFLTAACRPENAATEYALLSALFAFSREIAGALSGFGAERMGYAGFFAFTALLALPGLAILPWVRAGAAWRDGAASAPAA